ncbi:T6SS immunity protein Tli4 family protein [Thauera sinica]|uniref:T6SS immunity protein Tli4 family protein n=1 Tax=Thauera sinica TaxID=2665146 RepID=A0ABW1ALB4_9RHOO|nr:T6SS immunity protein Tli4 family protein [Thauera sp. K11]ATE60738.1 hypothetical protein CCZ27_12980 [Thauera sp. K11]
MSARIDRLFTQTKRVCFGRYTLEVPAEARLIFGTHRISGGFKAYPDQGHRIRDFLNEHWGKVQSNDPSAEIIEVIKGPVPGGEYYWYHEDAYDKRKNIRRFFGAIPINGHTFTYEGWALNGKADQEFARQARLIQALRYRDPDEIPQEPGVCIELGFVAERTCQYQEMFAAGIHMPSLPDVRFSVFSNKGAEVDKEKGGLMNGIAKQKKALGIFYPSLSTLREGARTVGVWDGAESLVRRKGGEHEFDWEFLGDRTVSHPGRLEAGLRSKIEQNVVGAAEKASINDDEALALWDRLLNSLAFRVPVPGGSRVEMNINQMNLRCGDPCPVTGIWRAEHPGLKGGASEHHVLCGTRLPGADWFPFLKDPGTVVWKLAIKLKDRGNS